MHDLLELVKMANSLTPLAIMGLLATAIILLARGRREVNEKMTTIADNHLHELPELVENSRRSVEVLQRIEVRLGEDLTYIKARVSDK